MAAEEGTPPEPLPNVADDVAEQFAGIVDQLIEDLAAGEQQLADAQQQLADVVGGGDSRQAWAVAKEPKRLQPLPPFDPNGQDDTKKLQGMIDAMVASAEPKIVEAGVYYISKPLRVGALPDPAGNSTRCLAQTNKRMLVGAGRDEVVIYALTPSMVMVTSDGCWPAGQLPSASSKSFTENSRFDVSGVTLAGGAVGFRKRSTQFRLFFGSISGKL